MKKMKRYAVGDMIEGDASVAEQMEKMPKSYPNDESVAEQMEKMPKSAPKNRIVTKEELEASGLSLRDFLNKERGLTRRGESAPKSESITKTTVKTESTAPKAKSVTPKADSRDYGGSSGTGEYAPEKSKVSANYTLGKVPSSEQAAANRQALTGGISDYLTKTFTREGREAAKKEARSRFKGSASDSSSYPSTTDSAMKRGGSVSSASKRGDGIAQRGKTRGKMC